MSNAPQSTLSAIWQTDTQQRAFRQIMQAFAHPGVVETLSDSALLLTLATLLDGATTLANPDRLVSASDWARLEAASSTSESAHFVLANGEAAPAFSPCLGTLESPEGGATLLLAVKALGSGTHFLLSGPGIPGTGELAVQGLHPAWISARDGWNGAFPLGVDMLLLADDQIVALPRTTQLKEVQSWDM